MRREALWRVSVITSLEAEDAVGELLSETFDLPTVAYSDQETKASTVSIYSQSRFAGAASKRSILAAGLKTIRDNGLEIGAGRVSFRRVPVEDWAESWKRHFKAIEIGPRLLIKPGWIKRWPRKNQAVVVLDPGLSFGTGNHPTTAFCLRELVAGRKTGQPQSLLDMGTGSGILAIAAAKLGYAPVRALDFDPQAVQTARENARQNGELKRIDFQQQDLAKLPRSGVEKYDLVCANLISDLLLREKKRILDRLRAGGILVLAGILKTEFPEIRKACEQAGLRLRRSKVEGPWRSGSFLAPLHKPAAGGWQKA